MENRKLCATVLSVILAALVGGAAAEAAAVNTTQFQVLSTHTAQCDVTASSLKTARELFQRQCGGTPRDCDPFDDHWQCASYVIGNNAPSRPTSTPVIIAPDVTGSCTVRGTTLRSARQAYEQLCTLPRRDCDPIGGEWQCSSQQLGSGAPAAEYVPELPHYSDDLSGRVKTLISAASGGRGLAAFTLPDENDFSAIPQDPLNPISSAKVELGKLLFHDTAFALDGRGGETQSWSCATCHHAAAGFKAGARQGIGNGGAGFGFNGASRVIAAGFDANSAPTSDNLPDLQPLASPTILHSAWQDVMLWNGQFGNSANGIVNAGIDPQRLQTPGTPKEANATGLSGVEVQAIAGTGVHRLRFGDDTPLQSNPSYQALWHATYGNEAIDPLLGAAKAMAAYERTVIANRAPFQRWLKGDESAMTDQQLLGAELFFGKAACVECHRGPGLGSDLGAMSDSMFFAIGFADLDSGNVNSVGNIADTDRRGRGGFTGNPLDDYKFKIPQLYNLTDANVFGHGGSFSSVRSVIEYKNAAVPQNPAATAALDYRFVPLGLTDTEVGSLADFIAHSLYDPDLLRYQPQEVPSGLCIIVNAQDDNAQGRCPEGIDVVR